MKDESMSYLDALKEIKRLKEAWKKVKEEINSNSFHDDLGQQWMYTESIVRIIDKHLQEEK